MTVAGYRQIELAGKAAWPFLVLSTDPFQI
jgi:hypothetical protein